MGMAARIGDMTTHGGSVVVGMPTVLIGGMPAARLGDMHVCPMVTPGVPPIPHVGGPITLGSVGVLIGGMPAARQGDMAVCAGPPDSIAIGCPTVMIGEISAGGGGGGGGGAGAGGSGSAAKGAITSAALASITPGTIDIKNHFLDVTFNDKAKLPIGGYKYTIKGPDDTTHSDTLGGQIKRRGIPEGNYEITLFGIVNAQWSKQEAEVGETVKMKVETVGIENGTKASLQVFIKDANYTDYLLETFETKVNGDKVEQDYTLQVDDKLLGICDQKAGNVRYSQPFFYYKVGIGGLTEQSALLMYKDYFEINLKDDRGNPIGNKKYKAYLPNGEIKEGMLDGQGHVRIDKVPPGRVNVSFDLNS